MEAKKILKSGYTTGSHAASALKAALFSLLTGEDEFKTVVINLPDGDDVELAIDNIEKSGNYVKVSAIKSDNDDIDVTKGCKIICWAGYNSENIPCPRQEIPHQPHVLETNEVKLFITAGKGLGVVTKKGLDSQVGFPAINPVPLNMMKDAARQVFDEFGILAEKEIYIVFEVENGEEIAKNTANSKAGIQGGLSLIGKKGIVKPISSEAYIESLGAEINVAAQNNIQTVIFTMGNSSLEFAESNYNPESEYIVEIGNFVFDTMRLLLDRQFSQMKLVTSIGKLAKIAQGKKNTNNRYGDTDFALVQSWLQKEDFNRFIIANSKEAITISSLEKFIVNEFPECIEKFYKLIATKALNELKNWANELNLRNILLEIILVDGKKLKYHCSEKIHT